MHGDVRLGGVVWTFLVLLLVFAVGLAVFVIADSVRRARRGDEPSPRMLKFTIFQAAFLVLLGLAQFRVLSPWLPALTALAALGAAGQGIAYLLRVVYPRAADDSADLPA